MKDIKEVLHLYLGSQAYWSIEGAKSTYHRAIDFDMLQDADYIMPILKRLSDMSEEDMKAIEITDKGYMVANLEMGNELNFTASQFNYLLKKGYWLFGDEAFDNGLIIDQKTLEK